MDNLRDEIYTYDIRRKMASQNSLSFEIFLKFLLGYYAGQTNSFEIVRLICVLFPWISSNETQNEDFPTSNKVVNRYIINTGSLVESGIYVYIIIKFFDY